MRKIFWASMVGAVAAVIGVGVGSPAIISVLFGMVLGAIFLRASD